MSEPTTAAGRALLDFEEDGPSEPINALLGLHWEMRAAILAIEQEARAALRAELAAAVEGLPDAPMDNGKYVLHGFLDRAAVLDLIRGDSPK